MEEEEAEEENRPAPANVRDRVAEVTAALAPFILPLIDGLAEVGSEEEGESVTAVAGEA
jgi:hypothetical protein